MRIALDISPLTIGHASQHKVRGSGFYLENLKRSLLDHFPDNKYIFFTPKEQLSGVDIVHIPYFEPFFRTLPLQKRFPTVVTVHDLIPLVFPKHFPPGIRGQIKWQIQKLALKNMNAIITDSFASKRDIARILSYEEDKIHVVYLAADAVFKSVKNTSGLVGMRKKYSLPKEFVLYVGDATWNKNLPRIIEAVSNLKIPFVMVGKALVNNEVDSSNPWNRDLVEVNKVVKNNPNILRLGFVPTEDLVALYNLATIFVMPSLYEGFGFPVLEAMASGCPVITSKEGSLSEVAGEAAYIVDPYSVKSIEDGIKEMFSNKKLRQEFSEKGRVQAAKFSWKKTAEQTIYVYEKILA